MGSRNGVILVAPWDPKIEHCDQPDDAIRSATRLKTKEKGRTGTAEALSKALDITGRSTLRKASELI
jgi:hypothetical protein